MTSLLVGCPVRQREWVLPQWHEHVLGSIPEGVDVRFAHVVGLDDIKTIDIISSWPDTTLLPVDEPKLKVNRDWGDKARYHHMVFLRNYLLEYARIRHADYFLSLDSDILLHKDTIKNLIETAETQGYDVVAGRTYLDRTDPGCTNVANWRPGLSSMKRVASEGVHPVDVVMALKLMNKKAYNVDYVHDRFGEDIGWSKQLKEQGLSLGFDGRTGNKHIMVPEDLDRIDKRVGW